MIRAEQDKVTLINEIEKLRSALIWIQEIADTNYEQDEKLRSRGARTLIRISDRAKAALGDTP